jgi:uncharacterized metal-binding protein
MSPVETCCGSNSSSLVYACAGASNVGQITYALALRLVREGRGTMSCLAGVGAHISGFVVSAKDCERTVVLDGCEQRCAFKVLEHVGVKPHVYLNLTDRGFTKRHGVSVGIAELDRALALAVEQLEATEGATTS